MKTIFEEFRLTDIPDIDNKKRDLRVLSLGAGVQSSTLLLMMLDGLIEEPDCAIFADTGNEPKEVYEWLDYLIEKVDNRFPIYIVKYDKFNGDIVSDMLSPNRKFASVPFYMRDENNKIRMGRRQCSREYKIEPLRIKIKELVGGSLRGKFVDTVIGISYDEAGRAKVPRNKWQQHSYPFIENKISRDDCKKWMKDNGYPIPPRSACIICPFHSNQEWIDMKNNHPEQFEEAIKFENELQKTDSLLNVNKQFLHRRAIPLEIAVKETDSTKQESFNLWDDECEGICGL